MNKLLYIFFNPSIKEKTFKLIILHCISQVTKVRSSDAGNYMCIPHNSIGPGLSSTRIMVEVKGESGRKVTCQGQMLSHREEGLNPEVESICLSFINFKSIGVHECLKE